MRSFTADILAMPLESDAARFLADALRSLATAAHSSLLHSGIEAGSQDAFKAVLAALETMYSLGAAIQLHRLGYKWSKA
jgi:hypothetical protein